VFTTRIAIATAALAAVAVCSLDAQTSPPRKVKDQGELDLYTETVRAVGNPARQIQSLDAWTRRYPDSEYKDDRLYWFLQAFAKLDPPQPAKVVEYGRLLMARGLATVFPGPAGLLNVLNVLYQVAWNVAALPNATADELAAGEKAARGLLEASPRYFVPENRPSTSTEAEWAADRADIEKRARTALIAISTAPGRQAMERTPRDCAAAEKAFAQALATYPAEAAISYQLGAALNCLARSQPDQAFEFAPRAVWQFVRAAELDPSLGGTADPAKIAGYAASAYQQYHGSDDGLAALRDQARQSPFPPAGFTIETAAAAANRKQKELADLQPQLSLWARIRAQLADANGQQYFDGQLKDLDVAGPAGARALKGIVVEGRPACRPKELLVAVPDPDGKPATRTELALRLDSPMAGKAVTGDEIEWDGVPRLFTRDPFMVTMDVPRARISGLAVAPCDPPPARKN
jgi:hypothetical protein